jgi:hypothetical protein
VSDVPPTETSIEAILDPTAPIQREDDDRARARAKAQRRTFLIGLMQHPEGRVWLKELLDRCHTFETRFASINGYARDDMGTWLMAGEQKVGWSLWEELDDADPVVASRLRRGA